MKAKKLEAILERYPWLGKELKGRLSYRKPDHRKLEFVAIRKMDNSGQFGDARAKFHKVIAETDFNDAVWEFTTWCVLFHIEGIVGKGIKGRYVSEDGKETVTRVISDIQEWWESHFGCGTLYRPPLNFVAVLKKVFRFQGSESLPTRVSVYLFN